MKNILVLGGTRFFGQKLVERLVERGHRVTICTRGHSPNPFGERVQHVVADRSSKESLEVALQGETFDLVYDNIGYSPNDAKLLCEVLNGRIGKLIFTSTLATYLADGTEKREGDFEPTQYPIQYGEAADFTYGEGKRLAEAVLYKEATFPVVVVRFPIVMGEDDYTERLHFYVRKVLKDEPFMLQNPEAKMGFIQASEAAKFLVWAGEANVEGPYNAAATGEITLKGLFAMIEKATGKKAQIYTGVGEERTPYDIPASWYMTNAKATAAGFSFTELFHWLPSLVENIVEQER